MNNPNDPNYGKPIPGAPIQGTPEAETMVQSLLRAIKKVDEKVAREMVPRDEMNAYVNQKGLGGLLAKVRKEDGSPLQYTAPAAKPGKKKKKRRVRMAI